MFANINNLNDSIAEHNTLADLHSFLEDYTDIGKASKELQNYRDRYTTQQKVFERTLNKEQRVLYNNLTDNEYEEAYILTKQAFIAGYKMATRLLMESMK